MDPTNADRESGNFSRGWQHQGDRYLRSLLTAGALAVIRYAKIHGTKHRPWLTALLARRPTKVAAIALAKQDRPNGVGNDGQGRALRPQPPEAVH
jgi:hypothetical protein